jgi:hypothetical protein
MADDSFMTNPKMPPNFRSMRDNYEERMLTQNLDWGKFFLFGTFRRTGGTVAF